MCRSKSIHKEGGPKRRQLRDFILRGWGGLVWGRVKYNRTKRSCLNTTQLWNVCGIQWTKQQTWDLQKQEKVRWPAVCLFLRARTSACVRTDLLNRYDVKRAVAPCWTSWVGMPPPYALAHHGSQFDASRRHKNAPSLLVILPPRLVHLVILKSAAHGRYRTWWSIIIIIIDMNVSCHRSFLPGTSLEPAVISTAQASSFTLQYFPYYVWCSKYSCLL